MIIPSIAIHMNREVNEGYAFNKQKDTLPLLGLINDKFEKDGYLLKLIGKDSSVMLKLMRGISQAQKPGFS